MTNLTYSELSKKQQKEFNDFPIAYAFDKKQLKEALEKLGVKDASECVTYFNTGDILKKTDVPALKTMFRKHKEELLDALNDEKFAEDAFLYEMNNHEYAINWDGDADVLACFYMKGQEDLIEKGLLGAYFNARRAHMKMMEENGII